MRIYSDTRPVENILKYKRWWLQRPDQEGYEAKLLVGRRQGQGIVAQISAADGTPVTDRDAAEALMGSRIEIARSRLPKLGAGEFYWVDLLGLEVKNLEGQPLGQVTDMTSNGAQDVMVLQDGDQERLIPFVHGVVVKDVDLSARVIVCDWQLDY